MVEQRMTAGSWMRVLPPVYLTAPSIRPSGQPSARVRVRATWLWAGEEAVISMHAAAWWWGMTTQQLRQVEVWVGPRYRRSDQNGVIVRRRALDGRDIRSVDGVLVTSRHRTAVDLASAGSLDRG